MNVADLVEKRRAQWSELEFLCNQMEVRGRTRSGMSADLTRFSSLYRAACADLALADAYQLPPATVNYLHNLVARAHNRLYRSSSVTFKDLWDTVFLIAPQQIFADPCVRIAAVIFFGLFSLSAIIGTREEEYPEFVNQMVGSQQVDMMEEMHENPPWNNPGMGGSFSGAGQYISHNTGIGITCFSYGILLIPCIATLGYNAVTLGTVFGYMARESVPAGDNFLHWVTAHGPFELTAIALAAGAGLRLGVGLFFTQGFSRIDSLRRNAVRSLPIISASVVLFVAAAFTEGLLTPSQIGYTFKAVFGMFSSGLIMFYFVVLGFPRDILVDQQATIDREAGVNAA